MHAWMNEEIKDGSLQEAGTRQKNDVVGKIFDSGDLISKAALAAHNC